MPLDFSFWPGAGQLQRHVLETFKVQSAEKNDKNEITLKIQLTEDPAWTRWIALQAGARMEESKMQVTGLNLMPTTSESTDTKELKQLLDNLSSCGPSFSIAAPEQNHGPDPGGGCMDVDWHNDRIEVPKLLESEQLV